MTPGWILIGLAFAYVGALFALAWIGDILSRRKALAGTGKVGRPILYACSLGVFCTSWTFFGSVGLAANTGYNFVPVYLGAIIAFALCSPLIQHIVRIAKSQNLTSVPDFLSARYGKSQGVAVAATIISVIGTLPYIALQLKAVVFSVDIVLGPATLATLPTLVDPALLVAVVLAVFAILFGTRNIAATEHQDGMMLAVAIESIIKLVAFLAVGLFVTLQVFGSPATLLAEIRSNANLSLLFAHGIQWPTWITVTLLSFFAILLLPRQFHVTVVESRSPAEIKTAAWLFPLYLIAINIFVLPIASAGLLVLPKGTAPDTFMLVLPQYYNAQGMVLLAFIGGLSAATAMVIVDSVALAIMVSNGLLVPLMVRVRRESGVHDDVSGRLVLMRRAAIFLIIMLGYFSYRMLGFSQGLASIGLVSFAAIAQLAPPFLASFFWRSGTASGAIAGMLAGFAVWAYTLIVPWLADAGLVARSFVDVGPFGLGFLAPRALFGVELEPLPHGVLWSLTANVLIFIFVSLQKYPSVAERQQAAAFAFGSGVRLPIDRLSDRPDPGLPALAGSVSVTVDELWNTVTRFLGADRAQRSFENFQSHHSIKIDRAAQVDGAQLRYAEHLLSSAVGAASSRLIMTLLLRRGDVREPEAVSLLDTLPDALQFNRDLLQTALDQVRDGIAVFDQDMTLTSWNRQFRELLRLAPKYGQVGVQLTTLLRLIAQQKGLDDVTTVAFVKDRFARLTASGDTFIDIVDGGRRVLEIRSAPMPQGGIVTTFADVTERWAAADALKRTNSELEARVALRTNDVTLMNQKLLAETQRANEANQDKTRFLSAVSHDVMQPLNAARLYTHSMLDRLTDAEQIHINKSISTSLDAVEEILTAVMDIARIDIGRMQPEMTMFPLQSIFDQLKVEFAPLATARGLSLTVMKTSLWVRSDRRMLRRVLQNLVSNALKYTRRGGVVLGARRRGANEPGVVGLGSVVLQVTDTGTGIPDSMRHVIFHEFSRLPNSEAEKMGLGLGLSIVDRVTRLLGHDVGVASIVGRGSTFTVVVPRAPALATHVILPTVQPRQAPVRSVFDGVSVLVIDNEPAILDSMRTLLTGWGCTVHTAIGIKAALDVLFSGDVQPALVFADFHLDDGNGLDAVSAVRVRLGANIPAAIITADTSADLARDARLFGCALLRKPVRPAQVRSLVNQFTLQRAAAE